MVTKGKGGTRSCLKVLGAVEKSVRADNEKTNEGWGRGCTMRWVDGTGSPRKGKRKGKKGKRGKGDGKLLGLGSGGERTGQNPPASPGESAKAQL